MFKRLLLARKLLSIAHNLVESALTIKGEWWIDDSGYETYADGDVGDVNHEMVAWCSALGLPLDPSNTYDYDGPEFEIGESLYEPDAEDLQPLLEKYKNIESVPSNELPLILWLRRNKVNNETIEYFKNRNADARVFQIMKNNWIRIHGLNFQLGNFDAGALDRIREFIHKHKINDKNIRGVQYAYVEESSPKNAWYGAIPLLELLEESNTVEMLREKYKDAQAPVEDFF